ncbi:AAA family ATPase [Achromobacter sp. SD115]|jgi:putative ATP-dependent endonuclease of OLD family|uniref:ATP-binding protein n=3 Tax=Achromobacter TaxID=222 RepID=A0A2T5CQS0_ALCXX|nr:ATP-binding protein [Achromobacter spanius]MBC9904565.1 AAA family ATPase [Achromobacter xylosoxidans]MBO1017447.1 AAA family ATPase [Achromobacter sp. SD115]CAB3859200.1 DNA replication and repair protein RecF [Achromobacter insuavis]MBD0868107.1 AAA family ATPase [Achromobacter xylosoxidans]
MAHTAHIRKLTIQRFRGIHSLTWLPAEGMNVILGGGDVGKTTILEAIALLLSPSNTAVLSEADYWARDNAQEFVIEAVMTLPDTTGIGSQSTFAWPWAWDGQNAIPPSADEEGDLAAPGEPVYRVRVRGTAELELAWEVMQPNEELAHFSSAVRRRIGSVRMSADERNDRDLRLVYGSALDRLLADSALRARIGKEVAGLDLHDSLNDKGKKAIESLDARMAGAALPSNLKLGLTTSQGLSIGALIGLVATENDVALPLSSWGAGTRRMSALEIASSTDKEASITLIDEIERGLEPYRLRKLIKILAGQHGQIFLTTHSPIAISCAEDAHLWYLDSAGSIGALPRDKIGPQQKRDPETFLARVAVIAEGPTEVGFLQYLLERAFKGNPLDYGVRVCDGQGNGATLDLLETLASSGLLFAGLADDEGTAPERWKKLKDKLKGRLHQWPKGCTEDHVIGAVPEENLLALLRDAEGEVDGYRLRTLAERLGLQDKSVETIDAALKASGKTWRTLIIAAASGSKDGAPAGQEKAWKKHSQQWFKSTVGGQELAQKMVALGAWKKIEPQLLPLINAVLTAVGHKALQELDL